MDRDGFSKWQRMQIVVKQAAVQHNAKLYFPKYSGLLPNINKNVINGRGCVGPPQVQAEVPSKYSILPGITKKLVESSQQADQVQAAVSSKYHVLPEITKRIVEDIHQKDQKERLKVRPLRSKEEDVNGISNKSEEKMTCEGLKLPMSPAVALKNFKDDLTSFEQKEIWDFPEIWYLGLEAEKITPDFSENSVDSDFDDEVYFAGSDADSIYDDIGGIYIPVLHDHIAYRYEVLEKLGQGSFGIVLKCLDHKTKELVAIKVSHNDNSANHMALRELEILDVVRKKDRENCYNVIHMKEHMYFRKHLCIVFELQGMDLYELIKKNNFRGFSLSQTHHYAASLVKSLQMLHRQKIIHCDLKPENILLSEKGHGNIKLADFGSSFYEHQKVQSYIQSRFYRAPEVILGLPFGKAIDMWSLGCILSELHTGIPLFSGANEVDQLACIMEVLGVPPDYIVQRAPRRKRFFDSNGQPKNLATRQPNSRDLANVLRSGDQLFLDFMKRCLTWDPALRMTADEAMQHEWLQMPPGTQWWTVGHDKGCLSPSLSLIPMRSQTQILRTRSSTEPIILPQSVEGDQLGEWVDHSVRQAVLPSPKIQPPNYWVLPTIYNNIVESSNQMQQKEGLRVSTLSMPSEEYVNSDSSKPVRKPAYEDMMLPISPNVALKNFRDYLTTFEQKEILDFPEIWYLGPGPEKMTSSPQLIQNNDDVNSDDITGIYIPVRHDHIAYRYEVLEKLGQGSFGLVLKCFDHKTKEQVAVKVAHNDNSANHMALQELEILNAIQREDPENCYNVIHMKEHMYFRNHLCIVFELQGMDLYELIKKNNFQGFILSQTHHYAVSLVKSLQMLHRQKIIHCDLKPENILLSDKEHGKIKVADFGCSFYEHQTGYSYVQTRFYRAPEVILGLPFGTAIDMWSLGCILSELHTGIPLFSGANEVDQLACIMEVLGMPPEYMVQTASRRKVFFDPNGQPKDTTRQPNSRDLASVLRSGDQLFLDFMRRCLTWDPALRMTADEAMQHEWLQMPPGTQWWTVEYNEGDLSPSLSSPIRSQTHILRTRSGRSDTPLILHQPEETGGSQTHGHRQCQRSQCTMHSRGVSSSQFQCCEVM